MNFRMYVNILLWKKLCIMRFAREDDNLRAAFLFNIQQYLLIRDEDNKNIKNNQ